MSDEDLYPNEIPNTGIGFSSTDGCPASAFGPYVSLVPSSQSGSRTHAKEAKATSDAGKKPLDEASQEGSTREDVGGNSLDANNFSDLSSPGRIVRKASTYVDSFALLIPDMMIPEHEKRDDVFRVPVSRLSQPEQEYQLFMTHKPGYDRGYLNIKQLKAEKREEFYVKPAKRFEEPEFVLEYNRDKPKGLENAELSWKEGRFWMKVDGLEFELKDCQLRAQEGKAVLDARLNDEEKNAVKIAIGIDGVDFRLARDHAKVTSVAESREGIIATYQRTKDDIPPHRRLIEMGHREGGDLKEWRHEFKVEQEGLEPERPLERKRDAVVVRISEENRRRVATYWASYESEGGKYWHQGDIGEELARCLLEKSGFRTVSEHTKPITNRTPVHKSENHGMERVVEKEGAHYVVQVKHWLNAQAGLNDAREDIASFLKSPERLEVERNLGIRLKGGIAIEVYWSYQELEAVIYTDYVEL